MGHGDGDAGMTSLDVKEDVRPYLRARRSTDLMGASLALLTSEAAVTMIVASLQAGRERPQPNP